jgi:PD-(D/E)XK nuclease superfamily
VIDNLTPKAPAWALEFGTGIHSALEAYYEIVSGRIKPKGDPLDHVLSVFEKWYHQMDNEQAMLLGSLYTDAAKNEVWEMRNLGMTMLTNYAEYSSDLAENDPWEVVAIEGRGIEAIGRGSPPGYPESARPVISEGRVLVPIVHPDTKQPLPGVPCLSGRIDLIVRRLRRSGNLWVVDHKTTATSPSDKGLDFEDQVTGYSYIVWRLTAVLVAGTIFNYLVKQAPKEPRRIQATKDNPTGLSTAKDQLCLARDYRQALIDGGLMVRGTIPSQKHADCYAALLATGWDPYFKRFEPRRNMHEIQSFERRLFYEREDMLRAFEHEEYAYPNPSTWHCPSCPVAPICQAIEDGSDVQGIIESRYMQAPDRKVER